MRFLNLNKFILSTLFCLIIGHQCGFAANKGLHQSQPNQPRLDCSELTSGLSRYNRILDARSDYLIDRAEREKPKFQKNTQSSIEKIQAVTTNEGIFYHVKKKAHVQWNSTYSELNIQMGHELGRFDLQGDPRALLSASVELAYFLGFDLLENETLIVPSIEVLNARIEQLSKQLESKGHLPIEWRFYEQTRVSTREYLNGISEHKLPIVVPNSPKDWNHFIHDISYHLAILLFPPDFDVYFTSMAEDALTLLDLIDKFELAETNPAKVQDLHKEFNRVLRLALAYGLDYPLGNIAPAFAARHSMNGIEIESKFEKYLSEMYQYHPSDLALGALALVSPAPKDSTATMTKYTFQMAKFLDKIRLEHPYLHALEKPEITEFLENFYRRLDAIADATDVYR